MAQLAHARLLWLCVLVGCGPVDDADPAFWTPAGSELGGGQLPSGGGAAPGGQGGAPGSGAQGGSPAFGGAPGSGSFTGGGGSPVGSGGSTTSSGACHMTFEFTTKPAGGKYSPKNIGGVWISNQSGAFVKSLEVWAGKRIINLLKWNAASGGNKVDAITSATSSNHHAHTAVWDCTDVNKQPVPDGQYNVNVEFTETDSAKFIFPPGPTTSVGFAKNGQGGVITPPDQQYFSGMKLTMQ